MSYSCLEELQVDLDLHMLDKINVLSKIGCQYDDGWLIITDDGYCYLFDNDGNLDDIMKITYLKEYSIRNDIPKIIIPNSVTNIGDYAFSGCSGLTSVTIPDSVTNIGWGAFSWCRSIRSVTIPNSATSIGNYVFYGCSGLTSVTIGNCVTNIGRLAFGNCNKLTDLRFKGKTLEQVKKMVGYPWAIEDESIIRVE